MSETAEIERMRRKALAQAKKSFGGLDGFEPGSLGCHEAFHMASVFADDIYIRLAEHPAVLLNPEWHKLAMEAGDKLFDLYQAIGQKHA